SYIINIENYKKTVSLYENKFGCLPQTARMTKGASLIGSPAVYHAKIGFIMGSLIYPYNRITNHDMSIEAYNFIRNLPRELTIGFKVEAIFWLLGFIAFACFVLLNIFFGPDIFSY
ncbi:hypothetical protein, partial [Citrobacter freundii]